MFLNGEGHLIHGCNNYCNMGAGIAKEVKRRIPGAYRADCSTPKGLLTKLGTFSEFHDPRVDCIVFNAYTQHDFWSPGPRVDYKAVELCFQRVAKFLDDWEADRKPLITPLIGAGLAGGDWERIKGIINRAVGDYPVIVVHFDSSAK
ncbi:ADP ribose binding protein [Pantoea phage Phynn]|nr:ADP ribose binding protein [Pantoea phage Phynn]